MPKSTPAFTLDKTPPDTASSALSVRSHLPLLSIFIDVPTWWVSLVKKDRRDFVSTGIKFAKLMQRNSFGQDR